MLAQLRPLAQAILPVQWFEQLQAVRSRAHQVRLLDRLGLLESAKRYIERNGAVVRNGPFAGMIYHPEAALNRHSIPKLLGTYELELRPILQLAAARSYDCVIDIGCAEGYYAVGLARLLEIPVHAYDPEPFERNLCREMAEINGVSDRVQTGSFFTRAEMPRFRDQRVLLICDCEGFEAKLFDAENVVLTANWDLLIELHGASRETMERLPWPHATQIISAQSRSAAPEEYPELRGIGSTDVLLSEFRGEQQFWMWCDSEKSA